MEMLREFPHCFVCALSVVSVCTGMVCDTEEYLFWTLSFPTVPVLEGHKQWHWWIFIYIFLCYDDTYILGHKLKVNGSL